MQRSLLRLRAEVVVPSVINIEPFTITPYIDCILAIIRLDSEQIINMIQKRESFWAFFVSVSQMIYIRGLSVEYKYFKAIHGTNVASVQPSTGILNVKSLAMCSMVCGADEGCSGYNYFTSSGQCELLKSPCLPGSETPRAGSVYMERLDNRFCKNQDVCYIYGKANWDEALAVCPLLHPDARMIQENSDEEGLKHIAEAVAAGQTAYFIAGRRPDSGDQYEFYWWPSGQAVNYTRWRETQPSKGTDEANCIMATQKRDWQWDDNNCSLRAMYMCELVSN